MSSTSKRKELLALSTSGAILVGMVIYWATQIIGVIEMLRLAYG
jgi:hypothetical protein